LENWLASLQAGKYGGLKNDIGRFRGSFESSSALQLINQN
jgi:hypothetical protein